MKKSLIAILFLFFSLSTFAQSGPLPYGFRLGLTAHPNFGFGKAENGKGEGVALGFSYGLLGDFNFAENYSFATGITITTMNTKVTEVILSPSSTYPIANMEVFKKYMMQYIEIPISIKLKTANINGIRWYGQFGISNDIRIGAKLDSETQGSAPIKNIGANDYTKFYRAGVIIGGGGEFELNGKTSLLLGVTLNNGFTNISTGSKVRNHNVGINVGVFF
ncbi:MAG: porin family protein [Pedobacter sp.]|nr:porin family protein [Pedobacter sp.]MDQ8053632.1 porin family protein [Pedobacter sp.]